LVEEAGGVVAGGFGVGEGGGEGGPVGVVEDLFRVGGDCLADLVGVAFDGGLCRGALGEGGQRCGGGLGVGGLEVDEGLAGGFDLLVVVVGGGPTADGDHGEDRGVQEHRQSGAVAAGRLAGDGADGVAEDAGVLVVGVDAGAAGTFESRSGIT
jgi:hypothetical protein